MPFFKGNFTPNSTSMKTLFFICFSFIIIQASAQRGIGFRFASDINHFYRSENYPLVDGSWSNFNIGPFFRNYNKFGGYEAGFNFCYKGDKNNLLGSVPLAAQDFENSLNVQQTPFEIDLRFGPSFDNFRPKTGYIMGWRTYTSGMLKDTSVANLNTFFIDLPIGISVDFPTSYGTVGAGIYYMIGLTNVTSKPPGTKGPEIYDGGKMRALNFEITVLFNTKSQPKNPPVLRRRKK